MFKFTISDFNHFILYPKIKRQFDNFLLHKGNYCFTFWCYLHDSFSLNSHYHNAFKYFTFYSYYEFIFLLKVKKNNNNNCNVKIFCIFSIDIIIIIIYIFLVSLINIMFHIFYIWFYFYFHLNYFAFHIVPINKRGKNKLFCINKILRKVWYFPTNFSLT